MNTPSPEKLKSAVQALYQVRAVEGPPGDHGQRSVWHMSTHGAELLSLVDLEGRVQRQELTLLDDHYVWTSGEGLRTGRVEPDSASKAAAAAAVVHTDPQLVPGRLMRAALALETYDGEDRYILHIKRVLALAREGLELRDASVVKLSEERSPEAVPAAPVAREVNPGSEAVPNVPRSSSSEGVVMLVVFGVGLVAAIVLFISLL
ncbi:hypothetical protein [Hyalangium versicolor]|uniref:hypothetical protein n=1 Tax=Hyalangium versicolor TaxID=2861190 RepID=UPI0021036FB6|nr:hypothetical protein [Hyalangium versicolor]